MSLPVLAKTWQFNLNQTITSTTAALCNSALLLAIKNTLTGFASTPAIVVYSCNGTTAGSSGDGIDRWSTDADVKFASNASAHSWIVLNLPGIASNFQVLISASPETGTYNSARYAVSIYISRSAGFSGGTTTGRPSATDEAALINTGTSAGGWGANGTIPATNTIRMQAVQSTDGANVRIFLSSSGVVWGSLLFETCVVTVSSGWSVPFHTRVGGHRTAGAFPQAITAADHFAYAGNSYINGVSTPAGMTAESLGSSFGPTDTSFGSLANEATAEWPIWPSGLVANSVGARGRWGTFIDLWYGSSAVTDGDTYDTTSKTFVQLGGLIMPWDGSTTPALT